MSGTPDGAPGGDGTLVQAPQALAPPEEPPGSDAPGAARSAAQATGEANAAAGSAAQATGEANGARSAAQSTGDRRRSRKLTAVVVVAGAGLAAFVAYAVTSAGHQRSAGSFPSSTIAAIPHGRPAPAFSLARLGGGPPVSLKAVAAGRPAVVNFFASWCPDCRAELRAFGAVSARSGGRVRFIGIDSNDSNPGLARTLLHRAGATYAVGSDPDGQLATSYQVADLPTTYFLDTRGHVAGEILGGISAPVLRAWVTFLEKPPVNRR